MAVLWQREVGGTLYEVRAAGQTRRLYTDGVFHSQLNLRRPVTGGVWDLLLLPAFFVPEGSIRRILALGVGGGAVLRQLLHFVGPEELVGVEIDPVHLQIARRFFGLRDPRVRLHRADALAWMSEDDGPAFDLIVDDLYGQRDGEPVRAGAGEGWMKRLERRLAPEGVLVMNFVTREELRATTLATPTARGFASAFELGHPLLDNAVVAFSRVAATSRRLRRRLEQIPELDPRRAGCRLRYRIRQLW